MKLVDNISRPLFVALFIVLISITTISVIGKSKISLSDVEKKVLFREMVNYDMSLRSAISNSAINNAFHTYRAFDAMTRLISSKNVIYKSTLSKVKRKLRNKKLYKYINSIKVNAKKASFLLKRKSKVSQRVWNKVDGYITKITRNCRSCHQKSL